MNTTDHHPLHGWQKASPSKLTHHKWTSAGPYDIVALSLRLSATALLGAVAWIHVHLWQTGYKHIPTIGPLFLAGALATSVVSAILLARPSRLLGVLGLAVDAGILAALIGSINFGLFGFTESLNAPFVMESILIESLAALALALWMAVDRIAHNNHGTIKVAAATDTGLAAPEPCDLGH
jgi:hypothetical protein